MTKPIFGVFMPQGWKMELVGIPDDQDKWAKAVEIAVRAEQLGLHLNRGGLADFYASAWADDPAALREVLSEVKAPAELTRILDESRKAFGAEVPASAEERGLFLSALAKKGVDPFNGLDAPLRELLYPYADAVATWARGRAEALSPTPAK